MIEESYAILLSIKPIFTEKILSGNKTIELRRRIGNKFIKDHPVFIYSTSPRKALVGAAKIGSIQKFRISKLTDKDLEKACISREACLNYFSGCDFGYAITLTCVETLNRQIPLCKLRDEGLYPPQSFSYVSISKLKKLGI